MRRNAFITRALALVAPSRHTYGDPPHGILCAGSANVVSPKQGGITRRKVAGPLADALKVNDPALAVEVAEYVVGVVAARQQSGAGLSVAYFKRVIEQEFGIPCGAHGKVNNIVKVMCRLGLIAKLSCHQFSTQKGKGLAARYEVGSAVTDVGCE